jgi:hypothetical protein
MPACFRPRSFRLHFLLFLVCVISLALGVHEAHANSGPELRPARLSATASSAEFADASAAGDEWSVDDRQVPLLRVRGDHLTPGLDQSLSYPLGPFRILIAQMLSCDDHHARCLLSARSRDGNGIHFVEFRASGTRNVYISIDGTELRLSDENNQKTITGKDGRKFIFVCYPDGEFHCVGIKDRTGNYLSFIYAASGLTLHGVADSSGRTITFNYAVDGITSVTQTWISNSVELTKTWPVGDQPERAPLKLTGNRQPLAFTNFKIVPTNALIQQYTLEMENSDKLLAQIFGGPNAVAAANGFEPEGLAASYPLYRGDIVGDDGLVRRGHLSYAMHLYGSIDGKANSPLYVPTGFASHSSEPTPTDSVVTFYYPRLGNLADVTVAVFHVADFELRAEGDRIRIGNIGGPGGSLPLYKHSHIEFYRGNTGLPPLESRAQVRIDPATVFALSPPHRAQTARDGVE